MVTSSWGGPTGLREPAGLQAAAGQPGQGIGGALAPTRSVGGVGWVGWVGQRLQGGQEALAGVGGQQPLEATMPSQVGASHRPGEEDAARGGWSRCRDRRPAGGGQPPAAAGVGPGDRRPRPGPVRPPGRCDQGGLGCRGPPPGRGQPRSCRRSGRGPGCRAGAAEQGSGGPNRTGRSTLAQPQPAAQPGGGRPGRLSWSARRHPGHRRQRVGGASGLPAGPPAAAGAPPRLGPRPPPRPGCGRPGHRWRRPGRPAGPGARPDR
jgi:translation initiation factor IF-2